MFLAACISMCMHAMLQQLLLEQLSVFQPTYSAKALLALTMSSLNIQGRSSCLLRELVGIMLRESCMEADQCGVAGSWQYCC